MKIQQIAKISNILYILTLLSCAKKQDIESNENFVLQKQTIITGNLKKIDAIQEEKAVITNYNTKSITVKPNDYTNASIAINLDEIGSDIITPKLNEELHLNELFQIPPLENITKEHESIQNLAESNTPSISSIVQTSESNIATEIIPQINPLTKEEQNQNIAVSENTTPQITKTDNTTTNSEIPNDKPNFNEIKNKNSFTSLPETDIKETRKSLDNIVNNHIINTIKNTEKSKLDATILTNAKEISPNVYKVINKDGTTTIVIIK